MSLSFLLVWYARRHETFGKLCHIKIPKRKNVQPLKNITHNQFLTTYSKRLTVQQFNYFIVFSKHYKVKLDLGGLTKARYPRITKRETKRVLVLSLWCDQRQETFININFFKQQLTNNRSKVGVLLWLFRAFYSLSFSSYICKVRDTHSENPIRRSLLTT